MQKISKILEKIKSLDSKTIKRFFAILLILNLFIIPAIFTSSANDNYHTPNDSPSSFNLHNPDNYGGFVLDFINAGENMAALDGKVFNTWVDEVQQGDVKGAMTYLYDGKGTGISNIVASGNGLILQQRPASGVDFIQDKVYALQNLGTVSAAEPRNYYQGTGYDLLKPIYGFWGWSVNLVYGILILIIIVLAFAIMFRQKLSGGTEVTIQNAIPSIALAMILIPFSYAITGLAIDLITLGTNAAHGFLFSPGAPGYEVYQNRDRFFRAGLTNQQTCTEAEKDVNKRCDRGLYADDQRVNWLNVRDNIDISQSVDEASDNINIGGTTVDNFALFYLIKQILDLFSGKNQTPSYWLGSIVNFILSLTMIWIGIKIFVKLFQKYLMILLMPIFSPFIFATIAIPGNGSKAIVNYLKTLGSASAAYVATYFMFLLTIIFTSPFFQQKIPNISTATFTPPLLGISDIFGGQSNGSIINLLMSLVGLGIYFSIPKVLEDIDAALGVKNAIPAFIKTPWESFQESWRVTTRTAPALAARTAIAAGRIGKNTVYSPWRGYGAARDVLDRGRGLNPETDYNSWRNRQRRNLASDVSAAQRRFDKAKADGDTVGMAKAQAEMTAFKIRGDRYGTGVGFQGEADKAPKLDVKFVWKKNSSPENEIVFTKADVDTYIASGATTLNLDLGELVVEGQNYSLPAPGIIEHGEIDKTASRIDVAGMDKTKPIFELKDSPFANADIFQTGLTNAELVVIASGSKSLDTAGSPQLRPDSSNKAYKIKMELRIANVRAFFGRPSRVAGSSNIIYANGEITPPAQAKGFYESGPRMFRIKGQNIESSKPLTVKIRIQY